MKCNECNGTGEQIGMFPKYAPGHSGPPIVKLPCTRCDGAGETPEAMLEWISIGEQCRAIRLVNDQGIREFANEYGMLPSELCKIENGKVDPTEHAIRIGVLVSDD